MNHIAVKSFELASSVDTAFTAEFLIITAIFFSVFVMLSIFNGNATYRKDPRLMNISNTEWWEVLQGSHHKKLIIPPDCFLSDPSNEPTQHTSQMSYISRGKEFIDKASDIYRDLVTKISSANVIKEPSVQVIAAILKGQKRFDPQKIPLDCTPLICFVNSKAGGNQGKVVISLLKRLLNPIQIFDLSIYDPAIVFKALVQAQLPSMRVLAAGGDGTVGWVIKAAESLPADVRPPIAILPLGTGNDLSRVLGWGVTADIGGLPDVLARIQRASVVMLDRWEATIQTPPVGKKKVEERKILFNNYLGVGVDAQIVLGFHTARELSPQVFFSQFVNKLWYGVMGGRAILNRSCAELPTYVRLFADGEEVSLPANTEGIIFSNIRSYGGGAQLWHQHQHQRGDSSRRSRDVSRDSLPADTTSSSSRSGARNITGDRKKADQPRRRRRGKRNSAPASSVYEQSRANQSSASSKRGSRDRSPLRAAEQPPVLPEGWSPESMQDGLMEVVAVTGSLHLAKIKVGIARPAKVAQGGARAGFELRISRRVPVQADGEPFSQPAGSIYIRPAGQAMMLKRTAEGADTDVAVEVIEWARRAGHITTQQRSTLLLELSTRLESKERLRRGGRDGEGTSRDFASSSRLNSSSVPLLSSYPWDTTNSGDEDDNDGTGTEDEDGGSFWGDTGSLNGPESHDDSHDHDSHDDDDDDWDRVLESY